MSEPPEMPPAKAVRDPESYKTALDVWIREQRPETPGLHVTEVDMPKSTGFSNETVFFTAAWDEAGASREQRYVARIEPELGALFPVQTPACETSVELQHRIMACVEATGVAPVPRALPFEHDRSVLGRPFFAMEFVAGQIPADVPRYSQHGFVAEEATPAERERMVYDGLDKMAALNRLDWKAAGLDWLDVSGRGEPSQALQVELYRRYAVDALGDREHPVLLQALDMLAAKAPASPVGVSWGDSRLGNMIWQDYRCAAVVDWEAASLAPPEADIGWWVMFDRMSFDDMDTPRLEGFPTREEMVAHWEAKTGRSVGSEIDYWEIFAVMRFCAIMIGLGDRMVNSGLVPAENSIAIENGTTDALARLMGIERR